MKRKALPTPPDDLAVVEEAQAAVPLVPKPETDCCVRIQNRLDLPGRDDAATWLDFLRALGLVEAGPSGFTRVRVDPDADHLAEAFLDGVVGATEALDRLRSADGPLDASTVADRTAAAATPWERQRHGTDFPAVWRRRTEALLDWLVRLGLAESTDSGYRAAAE